MASEDKSVFREYVVGITIAVVLALLVRLFIFEAYRVPTSVMKPTLIPGDLIFVSKLPFGLRIPFTNRHIIEGRNPKYGEVVIYAEITETTEEHFIKRVVGLPGDTVKATNGHVTLNGHELKFLPGVDGKCGREALGDKAYTVCLDKPFLEDFGPITVPSSEVLVISDWRSQLASRKPWDTIPVNSIRGKVLSIWLSIDPATSTWRPERIFKWIW